MNISAERVSFPIFFARAVEKGVRRMRRMPHKICTAHVNVKRERVRKEEERRNIETQSLCYVRRFGEWHVCRCDAVDGRLLRVSNMLLVQIVE